MLVKHLIWNLLQYIYDADITLIVPCCIMQTLVQWDIFHQQKHTNQVAIPSGPGKVDS